MGWGWGQASYSRNNTIRFTEVSRAMCGRLVDGGSIYTLGPQPGSSLHHNYLRKSDRLPSLTCMRIREASLLTEAIALRRSMPPIRPLVSRLGLEGFCRLQQRRVRLADGLVVRDQRRRGK